MPKELAPREWWPPERHAKCLAGLQVGMVTGQLSAAAFGTVSCHMAPSTKMHQVLEVLGVKTAHGPRTAATLSSRVPTLAPLNTLPSAVLNALPSNQTVNCNCACGPLPCTPHLSHLF